MSTFELDIDAAIMDRLKRKGFGRAEFDRLDALIIDYAAKSGRPEEAIAMIVLDGLDTGYTAEDIATQLRVYDSKGPTGRLSDGR